MRISIGNQERSIDNPYEDFHADLVVTNIHYDVMKHLINSKAMESGRDLAYFSRNDMSKTTITTDMKD